ncbi:hypothetical protein, partial [Moorena sp. SIO4A1]|uniref:hypothetical protein n=1 Tax=Moorena sp. SIO4A1 TaxID=2607835 RepID=UPI0025ED98F5
IPLVIPLLFQEAPPRNEPHSHIAFRQSRRYANRKIPTAPLKSPMAKSRLYPGIRKSTKLLLAEPNSL